MKLEFDVESDRPHHLVFSFDKLWSGLSITVDGQPAVYELWKFSARGWDVRSYSFTVGAAPTRYVVLEKWGRSGPFSSDATGSKVHTPGLLPQPLRAFVDGELVAASKHQPEDAPDQPITA